MASESGDDSKIRLPRSVSDPTFAAVKVTRQEIDALVGVLDYYIPDLHCEIARTEQHALRERLRAQEARLTGLRRRLLDSRAEARDSDDEQPSV
ncbi:MAG: hypothetical protein JWM53_921 [bacterium]|nr:hypothetical protein [bacterium]